MHKSIADVTGREIKVGDWVAYAVGTTDHSLRIAKVVDLIPRDVLKWDYDTRTQVLDYTTDTVKVRSFIPESEWDANTGSYKMVGYRKNNQKFTQGDRFIVLPGPPNNVDVSLWDS